MYPSEGWFRAHYGASDEELAASYQRTGGHMDTKAVSLISGGLDSTVLAYLLQAEGFDLNLLSVNYGQIHKKELIYARQTALRLHVPHQLVDLRSVNPLLAGSALTDSKVKVPSGRYDAEQMKATVVPNRNAMMLSIAWAWAVSINAEVVAFAPHAGDHAIYPDCREPFIDALEAAFNLGNEWAGAKTLMAPFLAMSKADIVRKGSELNVPFNLTWSCYGSGEAHCGRCGTCTERAEAFFLADVQDPTDYADPNYWRDVCSTNA
jgi:7-cyano-7-deazaguanine synthase